MQLIKRFKEQLSNLRDLPLRKASVLRSVFKQVNSLPSRYLFHHNVSKLVVILAQLAES